MVKWTQNTICDIFILNSRSYEIFEVFLQTVVISPKTVKLTQNTICVACELILRKYEIFEVRLIQM